MAEDVTVLPWDGEVQLPEELAGRGLPLDVVPGVMGRQVAGAPLPAVAYTASALAEIRHGVCRVSGAFRRTCAGSVLGRHPAA